MKIYKRLHDAMLDAGLDPTGGSRKHVAIVMKHLKIKLTQRRS